MTDKEYYENAKKRLSWHQRQLKVNFQCKEDSEEKENHSLWITEP